jgi:hypothetical protein
MQGLVRYPCPLAEQHCAKTFSSKARADRHKSKHSGIRYPCPLAEQYKCTRTFACKDSARNHKKTHTESHIRYPCPLRDQYQCALIFSTKWVAQNHAAQHSGICHPCPVADITNALKLLLMWLLLGCMLKANILGSSSPALWPTGFNASPKLSHHKSMFGCMPNLSISKFDFLALERINSIAPKPSLGSAVHARTLDGSTRASAIPVLWQNSFNVPKHSAENPMLAAILTCTKEYLNLVLRQKSITALQHSSWSARLGGICTGTIKPSIVAGFQGAWRGLKPVPLFLLM